ncbi:MAG: hypothetical protein US18_C0006G0011 [Parcubacteria group bacterium GW2011_GWB1_36_5]|nr:MAG: hypothetical protein US12_C0033G0003 [Parcubacteria group bacterium GW2011_GWA2_36_24]KKQ07865.1 MAG: hypothetical protein US18_C0006G0011 [Parcubacteria group bacterium GW2011_GWB1_36_5]
MPKIKNIIIFLAIGAIFVSIYIFYIKPPSEEVAVLVSSSKTPGISDTVAEDTNPKVAQDFLNLLLSIKSIKLNDAIFSDKAFINLHDSSIVLIPDGNEGRPNPFAKFGNDVVPIIPLTCNLPKVLDIPTNTCINPLPN